MPSYAKGMPPSDRRHLHYLPVYELHPVVLREDPGLAHLAILLDGEAMSYGAHLKPPYGSRLPSSHFTRRRAGGKHPFLDGSPPKQEGQRLRRPRSELGLRPRTAIEVNTGYDLKIRTWEVSLEKMKNMSRVPDSLGGS
jgi:hypothetical protein